MMLKTLVLLSLSLPLFSVSSSRNTQPLALADTYRVSATGGVRFNVRGTAHARYTTETYRGVPGTRGYARNGQPTSMLQIHLIAPGNQWQTLYISVTNYNSRRVADKLYLWTYIDYRGGEPLREENVDCRLELTNGPEYWDLDKGQIQFEYYGAHRMRGTFTLNLIHMFYRRAEPDASKTCRITGSFDTAYDIWDR